MARRFKDLRPGDAYTDPSTKRIVTVLTAPKPSVNGRVEFKAEEAGKEITFAVQGDWEVGDV